MDMQAEAPNIVFIITDQFHANAMACAGNGVVKTPNLDRLAKEGVRFTNAFAASAHCGPSRLSILTGMYEHTHRRHGNEEEPPAWLDSLTLPAALKASGYQTAIVGKGHLGVYWPRRQFDYGRYSFLSDAIPGDLRNCDYYRFLDNNGLADKFAEIDPFLWEQGRRRGINPPSRTAEIPLQYSVETWCGDEMIGFLRQRDPARPFFAYMSFDRPHSPLTVPAPYDTMYNPDEIILPENSGNDFKSKSAEQQREISSGKTYAYRPGDEDMLKKCMAHYYGLVSLIDDQVGRVIQELEAEGILDKTIIVFTADHGDFAGEHGLMFKNFGMYDAIHRIPLLMRYPSGLPQGGVFHGMVELVDLFPVLADLVGVEPPASVEGRSFLEFVKKGESDWNKKGALLEHATTKYHYTSLRTSKYRINFDLAGTCGLYELYDYTKDPGELVNCWDNPEYREIRLELLGDLLRYRSSPPLLYGAKPPAWKPVNRFYNNQGLPQFNKKTYLDEYIEALSKGTNETVNSQH